MLLLIYISCSLSEKFMRFLLESTEFFENELKNLVGSGFEWAVFILQKSDQVKADFKAVKLKTFIAKLLNFAKLDLQNQLDFKNEQTYKYQFPAEKAASIKQLQKQVQETVLNLTLLHKIIALTYTLSGSSIISLTDECLNFSAQNWKDMIKIYQRNLKVFAAASKQVNGFSYNNATSLFSIVYKIFKELANILQISCDIFNEALYIFRSCKQIQQHRKANQAKIPKSIISTEDLTYITELLSYKLKIKDEISQLDKFSNLPKSARLYLKSIYTKFQFNFNSHYPFSEESLENFSKYLPTVIAFWENHKQIFLTFYQIVNKEYKSKDQVQEAIEISKQITKLEGQLMQFLKLEWNSAPIDLEGFQQTKRMYLKYRQQFIFAQLTSQIFAGQTKPSSTKLSNKKLKDIFQKIAKACNTFKQ